MDSEISKGLKFEKQVNLLRKKEQNDAFDY